MEKTLKAWKAAQKQLQTGEKMVSTALDALAEYDKRHRAEHPLSQTTKKAIIQALKQGESLCCGGGLEVLKETCGLDECWAEHLNDWAYAVLGCSSAHKPGGGYHLDDLQRLHEKLNKAE